MKLIGKYGYALCEGAVLALWLWLALGVCPFAGKETVWMLAGVWVCVRVAAHFLGLGSKGEKRVLLWGMAVVGVLLIANLDFFMGHPGAHGGQPYLANWDAAKYWAFIQSNSTPGRSLPPANFSNYAILMSPVGAAWGLRGVLGVNSLCVMLTICACGRIARECCRGTEAGPRVSAAAMLMLTLVFNFMALGSVLLKDAVVDLAFAGAAAALLVLRDPARGLRVWPVVAAALCCVAGIWVRPLSGMMLVGLLLLLAPWERLLHGKSLATGATFLGLTMLCVVAVLVVNMLMLDPVRDIAADTVRGEAPDVFSESNRGSSLTPLISSYPVMPRWERALLLPATMGLQVLLPLPWTFLRHFDYGPSVMLSHFGLPYYLEIGAVLYFLFFGLRRAPRELALTTCTGVLFFAATAYVYGGTVSRYGLMFVPMMLPAAGWVAVRCGRERKLLIWMGAYALLLALALGVGMYLYNLNPSGNDLTC